MTGDPTTSPILANGFDCSLFGVITIGVPILEDFAVCVELVSETAIARGIGW